MFFLRFAITLCLLSQGLFIYAQNLVLNPGFESLKKSPCFIINTPDNIGSYVFNWVAPTGGTSDVNLSVGPDSCPANLKRFGLLAHGGNVAASIITLSSPNAGGSTYREYLQTKLSKKLTIGKVYYVELYASPMDANLSTFISYYSNNIGCYFSVDSIHTALSQGEFGKPLLYTPQINEDQVMDKPRAWHKISGCFTAKGEAQFLTIGNFFENAKTKYVELDSRQLRNYYFIDDVSVTETNLTNWPVLAFQDTTLCPGKIITVSLPTNSSLQYHWQDGTNSSTYSISQAGTYSLTATAGPCHVTNTFTVTQEMALRLPQDTTLCRGATLLLKPVTPFDQPIIWSDRSANFTLTVSETGIYSVQSESPYCPQTDSIRVSVVDCPSYIPNVFTPNNDGVNDSFFLDGMGQTTWRLEVYNRWGSQVYMNEDYQNNWEGGGLPAGTYYFLLTNTVFAKRYKGWVTIIR